MEKRLLSCALLHHLKPEKCLINNCKLCCCRIRNRTSIYNHTFGSNRLCDKHTQCSINEAITQNFLKLPLGNHRMKQQLSNSRKESIQSIVHSCDSSHKFPSFDTSSRRNSVSFEKVHPYDSFQPHVKENFLRQFKYLKGKCIGTLLHKTYFNLKDNNLLSDQLSKKFITHHRKEPLRTFLNLHETLSLPNQDINCSYSGRNFHNEISKQSPQICGSEDELRHSKNPSISEEGLLGASSNPSIKELFKCNMYNKYQCPTPKEALRLSAFFPEPKRLMSAVVKAMMRADENCVTYLVVAEHLLGNYWKAHLTFFFPRRVTFHGIHSDKDKAIHGAYLVMCEHLKNIGLIFRNKDGSWQPMTCERVMIMLETLSKYGESSLGCSRGKGFKIVLEQAKEGKSCPKENIDDYVCNNVNGKLKDSENKSVTNCLRSVVGTEHNIDSGNENVKNLNFLASVNASSIIPEGSVQCVDIDTINVDFSGQSTSVKRSIKPRWICTIHVGWPFPFSVQAEGSSLPAAQTMGYMLAVNKIKIRRLLTPCNNSLSRVNIERLMIFHTQKHFNRSVKLVVDKTAIEKFSADAELFCDASLKGFGAFLSLEGTQKVSWLSEEWEDHQMKSHHLVDPSQLYLHTLLAELFVVVTAVFTWKHKLRSRRLLCFSDNLIVMGLINSFASEPLSAEKCTSSLDHLIYTLQTTCLEYSIKLQATWLDRRKNWLADRLSRNDIVTFQAAVPEAAAKKSKVKKLNIRD